MTNSSEGLKDVEAKTTSGAPATVSALSQKLLVEGRLVSPKETGSTLKT